MNLILSLLIIPIVSNSVHDSNQDLYNVQIENIKEAARLWSADHVGELPDEGDTKEIYLSDLTNGGYIGEDLKNPHTKKNFSSDLQIQITCKNGNYQYTVKESK